MAPNGLDRLIGQLTGVRRRASGWTARCPAHDDHENSLSITLGSDGRILLHCFAGCTVEAIVSCIGLEMSHLFVADGPAPVTLAELAADKRIPESFLRSLGLRDVERGVDVPYFTDDGAVAPRRRLRTALRAKDGSYWNRGHGSIVPYGLNQRTRAREAGYQIIVEGESDCWTLWFHGRPALGIPGADMTHVLWPEHLDGGSKVFVLREPGQGGSNFIAKVAARIASFGTEIDVREFSLGPHKDANDLHRHDDRRFDDALDAALAASTPIGARVDAGPSWTPPTAFYRVAVPEFPVDCLPDWLADFVAEVSVAIQTPTGLAGSLVLGVTGLTIARRVGVEVRPGWTEPVNLYTAVALAPGNRKSAVFSAVERPLLEFEAREAERLAPQIREQLARKRVLVRALKQAEAAAAKQECSGFSADLSEVNRIVDELAKLEVPVAPRFFTDDATPEALSRLLAAHGGRFGVLSAEGGVFEIIAGRYANDSLPNLDLFLKGHQGDTIRVDRVSRDGEYINAPALTVALTVQPDVLRSIASKPGFRGRGLLARFLYVIPNSPVGNRTIGAPPVSDVTIRRYGNGILDLITSTPESADPTRPPIIRFALEAREAIESFEKAIEPRLATDGDLGWIADWAAKLTGAIARLAGILHVASLRCAVRAVETPIPIAVAMHAIRLGEFFLEHAHAAFAAMGADPEVERARIVLAWLRKNADIRSFSIRDAHQALKSRFQTVEEIRPTIRLLLDHDYIRSIENQPTGKSGRPGSPRYEVNPRWDRNSEDIEDSEGVPGESNSGAGSFENSILPPNPQAESNPRSASQNPQNPQNPPDLADDDELAL